MGGTYRHLSAALAPSRSQWLRRGAGAAGGRFEAWGAATISTTQGSGVQNNPCSPGYPNGVATSQYLANRTDPQQQGSTLVRFRVFDPNTLTFTSDWINPTSLVRALPSDYAFSESWMVSRFAPGGRDYLYTGSKDGVICIKGLVSWNPWAGSGIMVTKVLYQP
ncbi:MAG TPA: hypothetical protein VFE33_05080 [Thermoanaerobaculia bacterium]|nr:hypothetical protein [Thermoanaerobaculia bacterium]